MVNKLIFANLAHRPLRTFLSVLAIGVEVTMILTLVGVSFGTLDASKRRAEGVGADVLIRPPGSSIISLSSAPMSDKTVPILAKLPGVKIATGTVIQSLGGFDTLTGIDYPQLAKMSGGFNFISGGPFEHDDDIIVDKYYAEQKHLHVGDHLSLANHMWRVSGIFESGKLTHVAARMNVIGEITGNPGKLSQIYLKLDDPSHVSEFVANLKKVLPGYQIFSMADYISLLTVSSVGMLKDFIGVVIGVAGIVGFIVVFMAMYTAVLERTREIGILKAVGAGPGYILNILFRETLLLAVIGTAFGIALTYGTQWLMLHAVPASLVQETVYWWWPIAAGIAIVGALLGTVVPALKAVKQDATEALSYE